MLSNPSIRTRTIRQGTTTVEFALTAPLLFLLLLGAVEFSRANMLRHTAAVAATEGARQSIIPGADAAECKKAAEDELKAVGFPSSEVVVTPAVITDATTQVVVDVIVPLSGDNGFVIPKFLKGAKIKKSVTLQRERAIENPSTERSNNGNGNANSGPGNNNGNGNSNPGGNASNSNSGPGNNSGNGNSAPGNNSP